MLTQAFIIDGKFLGTTQRQLEKRGTAGFIAPPSLLFFCPVCGEVWARCPVTSDKGKDSAWESYSIACKRHSVHALEVPGSIWLSWQPEFLSALPSEVLRHELLTHLNFHNSP